MTKAWRRVRSLVLFLIIPGISAVAPLLIYPAVTTQFGKSGFAALAIGQSVGIAVGVICELGWNVVGPQKVVRLSSNERSEYIRSSLATKLLSVLLGAPIAAALAYIAALEHDGAAAIIAVGMSFSAFSSNWFLTGLNRPGYIMLSDSLPRVVLTIVSAGLIFSGAPLHIAALPGLATPLISVFIVRRITRSEIFPVRRHFRSGPQVVRGHLSLTFGRAVSVTYTSFLTTLVGFALPSAVVLYAATDRILRMGLNVLSGVPSRMQSWVGAASGRDLRKRSQLVVFANAALGLIAGFVFLLVAPWVGDILFVGEISVTYQAAAIGGATAFMVCTSRGLGLALVARGKANWIASANIAGAAVGVVAVFLLTPSLGAVGALLSALGAESAGVIVQLAVMWLLRPQR